ncbi:MAG: chorismate-binding protein [Marinilabiliaceae bacterium]|nr:chorismate-binding protein [Marinilabiliaceae bacterium]
MNNPSKKDILKEAEFGDCDSAVMYRLPLEREKHLIIGKSQELVNGLSQQLLSDSGFVIEAFNNKKSNGVFVKDEYSLVYTSSIPVEVESEAQRIFSDYNTAGLPEEIDFETYKCQFEQMHRALSDRDVNKVILSRAKIEKDFPRHHLIQMFHNLCENYPHAFVYVLNSPLTGLWIGAGPELLLKDDGQHLQTVSLAGTLPNDNHTHDWHPKELTEQLLVTDYIEKVLTANQVSDYQKAGPSTMVAGQVKHLRTDFTFQKSHLKGNLIDLLYDLHPTPAVCGMSKNKALKLIQKIEGYDRRFYSGFLGPVNSGCFEFYVNIRCLQLATDQAALYVGGGLTRESQVEKEWTETELKAETLLSVIKNMRNLQTYE